MKLDLNSSSLSSATAKRSAPGRIIRSLLFWAHLVSGLLAGVVILIMCFTGTVLAFEKEIVAWVDRAGAKITAPTGGAPRLGVDQIVERAQAAQPGARASSIIVKADPAAAVTVTLGQASVYVNPYSGEVTPQGAAGTRAFMRTMTSWHRNAGFGGENRTTGKQITGAGNLVFLALAVTGLYLWVPRKWSWRALRPSVWFTSAKGKARDWNWHNVIGLWTTPVLIVLTLTALPISYTWASGWINSLNSPSAVASPGTSRNTLRAGQGPDGAAAVSPGGSRQSLEALLVAAQAEVPDWKQITMRLDGGTVGGRGGRGPAAASGVQTVSFTIREAQAWPRTANTTLTLNPFTAEKVSLTGYAQMQPGQRVRAWTRFLHTGEALGPVGQLVAGLGCLGGCFLAYTGFALSWRRFFGRRG